MVCEPGTPFPEGSFLDVQPLPLVADRPDDKVDMRVWLIGMQSHHIAVLESELLPGKIPHRRMDIVGLGSGRHGERDFMD